MIYNDANIQIIKYILIYALIFFYERIATFVNHQCFII